MLRRSFLSLVRPNRRKFVCCPENSDVGLRLCVRNVAKLEEIERHVSKLELLQSELPLTDKTMYTLKPYLKESEDR